MLETRPLSSLEDYIPLATFLNDLLKKDPEQWREFYREQSKVDLYFLMRFVMSIKSYINEETGVPWAWHPYVYKACRAVEFDNDGVLNVWARGHWKSSIRSARTIQNWLKKPGSCQAIFSVSARLAQSHVYRIMRELQDNPIWHLVWPDIFYSNPEKDAKPWSVDKGLAIKGFAEANLTGTARNEWSLEGHAIDTTPTGKHYDFIDFDDLVAGKSVTTEDQILKVMQGHDEIICLTSATCPVSYWGTFYRFDDPYVRLIDSGVVRLRMFPAAVPPLNEKNSDIGGTPVFYSEKQLRKKKEQMSDEINYFIQYLCQPNAGRKTKLNMQNIRFYENHPRVESVGKIIYLVIDPGGSEIGSDPTAIMAVGLGCDKNYYVLDMEKGNWDPSERANKILDFHQRWNPMVVMIEEVQNTNDSWYLRQICEERRRRFEVHSVTVEKVAGGPGGKRFINRNERLYSVFEPMLAANSLYLPRTLPGTFNDKDVDWTSDFIQEITRFPISDDHFMCAFGLLKAQHGGKRCAPDLVWPADGGGSRSDMAAYGLDLPISDARIALGENSWMLN